MLSIVWTLDRDTSTFTDDAGELDAFHRDAREDFGASPWAALLPRPAREDQRTARRAARQAPETAVAAREPAAPSGVIPPPEPAPVGEPPLPGAGATPEPEAREPERDPQAAEPQAAEPELEQVEEDLEPDASADESPAGIGPIAALQPPPGHPLAAVELGMTSEDVETILGDPDDRQRSRTGRAWIPFYTGPDAHRITWTYTGRGRVVFSVDDGILEVIDVVYGGVEAE